MKECMIEASACYRKSGPPSAASKAVTKYSSSTKGYNASTFRSFVRKSELKPGGPLNINASTFESFMRKSELKSGERLNIQLNLEFEGVGETGLKLLTKTGGRFDADWASIMHIDGFN